MRSVALLLCPFFFWGCGGRKRERTQASPSPQASATPLPVTGTFTQARTVFSDGKGNRVLELRGGRFALPPGVAQATLSGTEATAYQQGKPVLKVVAREVRVAWGERKLTALGAVSAQTPEGRTVRCDTLTWRPDQNQVVGRGNVVFASGTDFTLYGSQFKADTLMRNLRILP